MDTVIQETIDTLRDENPYRLSTRSVTEFTAKCMACHRQCGLHIRIVEVRKFVAHNLRVPSVDTYQFCEPCFKDLEIRTFNSYKPPIPLVKEL